VAVIESLGGFFALVKLKVMLNVRCYLSQKGK